MTPQSNILSSFPPHMFPVQTEQQATTALNVVASAKRPQFVHPQITSQDLKQTLENYRQWVHRYNVGLKKVNNEIKKYNTAVKKNKAKEDPAPHKIVLINLFRDKFTHYRKAEYNEAARSFNELHGKYITLRKFSPIKSGLSLEIFTAFVHEYSVQLQKTTAIYKRIGRTYATSLPKASINPHNVVQQTRNGIPNLSCCKRTIQNHKQRLEEAGILIDKQFRGSNVPVNYFFNPEILVVSEGFLEKTTISENQLVTEKKCKVFRNKQSVSTSSTGKQSENKGIVNNSDDKENASHLTSQLNFYNFTASQDAEKIKPPREKNSKPGAKFSNTRTAEPQTSAQVLQLVGQYQQKVDTGPDTVNEREEIRQKWLDKIELDRRELAKKLAAGEFDYYAALNIEKLSQLKHTSLLNDEEYRELTLQDAIKIQAARHKNTGVGIGSWMTAIKFIDADFGCRNYQKVVTNKADCLEKLKAFRYITRWSITWFKKPGRDFVFWPHIYFDPTRDLPSDVCWQYAKKVWSKKMQKIAKDAEAKKKRAAAARIRKTQKSNDRKLDNYIYAFLREEKTMERLIELVAKLPVLQQHKFNERLSELTQKKLTKKLKY